MSAEKKISLLLICFFLVDVSAQDVYPDFSQLQGIFWVERGYQNSYNAPLADQYLAERSNDEVTLDLLELSRQWFSGIIYGYDFYYRPLDRTREVEEIFTLDPVYQIPWGDSGLEYIGYTEEDQKVEMAFRYFPREYEISRLRGWRSSSFPNSAGQASTPDHTNFQSRIDSFEEAVKQALRNHFRAVTFNKPREITGRVALFSMPRSFATSGEIYTSLKIIIDTDSLVAYSQF